MQLTNRYFFQVIQRGYYTPLIFFTDDVCSLAHEELKQKRLLNFKCDMINHTYFTFKFH